MSIDVSAAVFSRTTSVPAYASVSFSAWIYLLTSSPPDYELLSIDDGVATNQGVGRNGSGPTGSISCFNDIGNTLNIRTHAQLLNTWTWIGLSCGPSNITVYWATNPNTLNNVGTIPIATGTPNGVYLSGDGFADGQIPALVHDFKIFNSPLSADELQYEAARSRPMRQPNTWLPLLLDATNSGVDFSGQGGAMTITGTPAADRRAPPIPWKG